MNTKLHVGNLPVCVTDQALSDKFARFGVVEFALVVKDDLSGESRGFGLVEMDNSASAQQAIKWLNFSSYEGQIMAVSLFESTKSLH
jgi:RNA recognition motif-containing protein